MTLAFIRIGLLRFVTTGFKDSRLHQGPEDLIGGRGMWPLPPRLSCLRLTSNPDTREHAFRDFRYQFGVLITSFSGYGNDLVELRATCLVECRVSPWRILAGSRRKERSRRVAARDVVRLGVCHHRPIHRFGQRGRRSKRAGGSPHTTLSPVLVSLRPFQRR